MAMVFLRVFYMATSFNETSDDIMFFLFVFVFFVVRLPFEGKC